MIKNLSQFVAFDAVARHLSFAQASRELGLASSSVAKSVAKLEQRLDLKLFNRTTRTVRLTEQGQVLHQQCVQVLAQVQALDQLTETTSSVPQGVLRISAPQGYGAQVIVPILGRLLQSYTELRVDLRLTDERADLIGESLDCAVRFGQLADSALVSRLLQRQPLLLCATPEYLRHHPAPTQPDDLHMHQIIAFRMPGNGRDRPLEFKVDGQPVKIIAPPRFQVSQGSALVNALLTHCGIAQLPLFMVEHLLASGELVELLPALRPTALDVTLLTPGGRLASPRLKVFIDALKGTLASDWD